eukprot:373387_1
MSGIYFITIQPLIEAIGTYTLQINCINYNTTTPKTSNTPNSTLTNTTSVSSDFVPAYDCDYHSNETYSLSSAHTVLDSMIVRDNKITIEFDIKLNDYCSTLLCNILYIGTTANMESLSSLSLSIRGIENYFQISVQNNFEYNDVYRIPNANTLLPLDNKYHHIYLEFIYPSDPYNHSTNTFKINNISHSYYSTSLIPSISQRYELYISNPWDDSLNAEISNICIKSRKYHNTKCDACQGEIKCGETLTGPIISSFHTVYLYFNLSQNINASRVIFDWVHTYQYRCVTYLFVYDINFNILFRGNGTDISCVWKEPLIVDPLYSGEYILGISVYNGDWEIRILCADSLVNMDRYEDSYTMLYDTWGWSTWRENEQKCEAIFETSLATIVTEQDLHDVINLIYKYDKTASTRSTVSAWIGMYKYAVNGSEWNWIDGTICDYTLADNCSDYIAWGHGQPDDILYEDYEGLNRRKEPMGTYLLIENYGNEISVQDVDIDVFRTFIVLCNAPNGRYTVQPCTNSGKCWINTNCCNDTNLNLDAGGIVYDRRLSSIVWYKPEVAYWNSTLFIFGYDEIHYTSFQLFDNEYVWNNKIYNQNKTFRQTPNYHWFAQDESFVYLYSEGGRYLGKDGNNRLWVTYPNILIQINLNNLDIKSYIVDGILSTFSANTYCMVAGGGDVYIFRNQEVDIFDANTRSWNVSVLQLENDPDICVMSDNFKFIYMFDWYYQITIKYHTNNGITEQLNTPNVCVSQGETFAIAAKDSNIYFHGCNIASWKTLIFNARINRFEQHTIDIDEPTDTFSYVLSQMTVFDDNILLLVHANYENEISLYYGLTDLISINLEHTEVPRSIWPSNGFEIKYYI